VFPVIFFDIFRFDGLPTCLLSTHRGLVIGE
jgi:hypothetical protein